MAAMISKFNRAVSYLSCRFKREWDAKVHSNFTKLTKSSLATLINLLTRASQSIFKNKSEITLWDTVVNLRPISRRYVTTRKLSKRVCNSVRMQA
jgi:hypothetical protein